MTDERMVRAFLALDPPEEVLREIGRVQSRLKKTVRGDVRWVRPDSIHLTLKFLGDIREESVKSISALAGKAAVEVAPFELAIGGAGVFPDMKRPRVIWLGMDGETERLAIFQNGLERALAEIGFPAEARPFRPHLTLGRIRSPKGLGGLAEALKQAETDADTRFTASGLCLLKSDLTPQGAIYTRLAVYPFTGQRTA